MTFSRVTQVDPLATTMVELSTDPSTSVARAATVDDNVTGSATGYIYMVEIDNHLNAEDTFVKFRFATSVPSLSGVHCHMQLFAPAREVVNYAFPLGIYYTTGLCVWVVDGATATSVTMPLNKVIVKMLNT